MAKNKTKTVDLNAISKAFYNDLDSADSFVGIKDVFTKSLKDVGACIKTLEVNTDKELESFLIREVSLWAVNVDNAARFMSYMCLTEGQYPMRKILEKIDDLTLRPLESFAENGEQIERVIADSALTFRDFVREAALHALLFEKEIKYEYNDMTEDRTVTDDEKNFHAVNHKFYSLKGIMDLISTIKEGLRLRENELNREDTEHLRYCLKVIGKMVSTLESAKPINFSKISKEFDEHYNALQFVKETSNYNDSIADSLACLKDILEIYAQLPQMEKSIAQLIEKGLTELYTKNKSIMNHYAETITSLTFNEENTNETAKTWATTAKMLGIIKTINGLLPDPENNPGLSANISSYIFTGNALIPKSHSTMPGIQPQGFLAPAYTTEGDTLIFDEGIKAIEPSYLHLGEKAQDVVYWHVKEWLFKDKKIGEIVLPKEADTIKACAFYNLDLKKIKISENIEKIETNAFSTAKIDEIVFEKTLEGKPFAIEANAFVKAKIGKIVFEGSLEGNSFIIGRNAFKEAKIEELVFKEPLDGKSFRGAFEGCYIQTVKMPDKIVQIDSKVLAEYLSGTYIQSLKLSDKLERIDEGAFCSHGVHIYSVELPQKMPKGSIGERAFYESWLCKINIPEGIEEIKWATFSGCDSLKEVNFPDDLKKIDKEAFYGCSALKKIKLPDSLEVLGHSAFLNCTGLEEVTLSHNLERIETSAFRGCRNLRGITFPASIKEIGACAFEGCDKIREVLIPESVERIEHDAFTSKNLTDVYIPGNVKFIDPYAFGTSNKNLCIYCSSKNEAAIKAAHTAGARLIFTDIVNADVVKNQRNADKER